MKLQNLLKELSESLKIWVSVRWLFQWLSKVRDLAVIAVPCCKPEQILTFLTPPILENVITFCLGGTFAIVLIVLTRKEFKHKSCVNQI